MKALIIDDQDAVRTALSLLLDLHGIATLSASTPEEALDFVRSEDVGVVIQDMNFSKDTTSGEEGIALFREIHELDPELPVILLTAWTSLESAVLLIKEGAADYLAKPWDDQKLVVTVQNLMSLREARDENRRLKGQDERSRRDIAKRFDLRGLVYQSRRMHELVTLAVHVAPSDAPVLIMGPNGSGKERLAEIVQSSSRRADKPFVRVNAVIKKRGRTLPPSTAGFLERLLSEMARAEEKVIEAEFGEQYRQWAEVTPRFIPKLSRPREQVPV